MSHGMIWVYKCNDCGREKRLRAELHEGTRAHCCVCKGPFIFVRKIDTNKGEK